MGCKGGGGGLTAEGYAVLARSGELSLGLSNGHVPLLLCPEKGLALVVLVLAAAAAVGGGEPDLVVGVDGDEGGLRAAVLVGEVGAVVLDLLERELLVALVDLLEREPAGEREASKKCQLCGLERSEG